ncbi:hypothetical protein [Novosphingobium sp.]|uniref:hypothetical protein n=1 Tax=Novosphingobium sp. TaxID=1874826 RepID=UPI0026258771|nr:hypothetical protein [Novosphingobium sp.]
MSNKAPPGHPDGAFLHLARNAADVFAAILPEHRLVRILRASLHQEKGAYIVCKQSLVIASAAKQSRVAQSRSGLLRCARNDDTKGNVFARDLITKKKRFAQRPQRKQRSQRAETAAKPPYEAGRSGFRKAMSVNGPAVPRSITAISASFAPSARKALST